MSSLSRELALGVGKFGLLHMVRGLHMGLRRIIGNSTIVIVVVMVGIGDISAGL